MKVGAKGKYNKKIVDHICELIKSDSYTIDEICKMAKINTATYFRWLNRKSEFCKAIKKAEDERMKFFVTEAKKSLLKKIQGYTVQEKHVTTTGSGKFDASGREMPKIKEQKTIDKHVLPDTAAIIFTLTNGDPDTWKNTQRNEITGKDGKDLMPARILTREEAAEYMKDLENEC